MDVVFAVLPFADIHRPAIGVSLLQAALKQLGHRSRVEYFNLDFAESAGTRAYEILANSLATHCLVGEWFFADAVFGDTIPHEADYWARILGRCIAREADRLEILRARQQRRAFVDSCVQRLRALQPRVVGFTTSFHQTCACLAVAQRLKHSQEPPVIVFGGANCEGEMGWQMLRSFPWIDFVSTGEADLTFPDFVATLLRQETRPPPPGILRPGDDLSYPVRVENMDALPLPDYSDYFERVRASSLRDELKPVALMETSRGCWWGAKQHCTFCGLNGEAMAYRSKTPRRAFHELFVLSTTYQTKRIDCVDNILDTRYLSTLFPMLVANPLDLDLFYEVKSNLRHDQVALLRAAGVRMIQPGIESFSNRVLRLMKKGCTGLQNIQLLRWCEELGIEVFWNILAGFPGESPDDYDWQAELIPLLAHLPPPSSCASVRLDRFSPFYTRPAEFGLQRLRPAAAYYYVFPLGRRDLSRLAYFFEFDYGDGRLPESYLARLREQLPPWWEGRTRDNVRKPALDAFCTSDGLCLKDTRPVAVADRHALTALAASVYRLCDSAQTVTSLARGLGREAGEAEIRTVLERLMTAKIMVESEGHYLSLGIFRDRTALEGVKLPYAGAQGSQASPPQQLLRVV